MRVLIAEDDAVSRLVLRSAVERLGHECLAADDGLQAWEVFDGLEIDVLISDWLMPGLDGADLCRRVRAAERSTYTYFMLLTALDDRQHYLAGMQAGADDYLTKPLDREELQVRLLSAARVTTLHRELAEKNVELERLNSALFQNARTDTLTQLGNRLRLRGDLQVLQGRVERYGHTYCLALVDIDDFGAYNEHYGHVAGDEAIQAVARTITQHRRSGDGVYRYGGEEFLVILPEQTLETASMGMDRIRRAVERLAIPHAGKNPPGVLTMSVGIAMLHTGEEGTWDTVLRDADGALTRAKQSGRNRVAVAPHPQPQTVIVAAG